MKINKKRIYKLADFIGTLERKKLNMRFVAKDPSGKGKINPYKCNSVACAMGWAPFVFPKLLRWKFVVEKMATIQTRGRKRLYAYEALEKILSISGWDSVILFGSGKSGYRTPKQVSKGLKQFADTGVLP